MTEILDGKTEAPGNIDDEDEYNKSQHQSSKVIGVDRTNGPLGLFSGTAE